MPISIWSRAGFAIALVTVLIDQGYKWWMLNVYAIGSRGTVKITPFFDITLIWNKGISYGLFQQNSDLGRYILIGIILCIMAVLVVWMIRAQGYLIAIAMGLVLGGALGNVIDRVVYGAVADFFSFHFWGYYWYVFNLADVWVVAGAVLLLYDAIFNEAPDKDVV